VRSTQLRFATSGFPCVKPGASLGKRKKKKSTIFFNLGRAEGAKKHPGFTF
jgi:hypothetical protein